MPRVLWLFEFPTLSGGERSLLAALPAIREAGFQVEALAPAKGPLAAELATSAVEHISFDVFDDAGARRSHDELRGELAHVLLARRADLLHANSIAAGRLSGPVVREVGMPSIAHLRDILKLSRGAMADLSCHHRLLAVSRATYEYHVAQGVPRTKTSVIYNGVDLTKFQPRAATGRLHRELQIDPEVPLVGAIGQIILRKGLDVLARAAEMLAPRFPELHYIIVGSRWSRKAEAIEFERKLEHDFRSGALAGCAHFLGTRDDVELLLPELTVLAHPARQEPLGRVLLEAAACGIPTVASDVGGTREIFPADARAALLVPADDAEAMAGAIGTLLQDTELRRAIGSAARQRAEAMFDARVAGAELADHYQQVVARAADGESTASRGASKVSAD